MAISIISSDGVEHGVNPFDIVRLDESGRLPPVDGSQLTNLVQASTSQPGLVELATDAEARAGTASNLAVTPANLAATRGQTPYRESGVSINQTLADRGGMVAFTAGGVTFSLLAGATAGAGFVTRVKHAGTSGTVTIDPNGSETIDGASTMTLYAGQWADIVWTGSQWSTSAFAGFLAGDIKMTAHATTQVGWIPCDGRALSRTDYPALFAAIGTTWGAGDGSTTFNVPDARGRGPIGQGDGGPSLTNRVVGQTGGEEAHTLTTQEMPPHSHGAGSLATNTAGAHTHTLDINKEGGGSLFSQYLDIGGTNGKTSVITARSAGNHSHDVTGSTSSAGGSQPHNNMQPFFVVGFAIKT
jgi:microcystin-dependent protein